MSALRVVQALDEEIKGAQAPIRKTKDERDQLRADMAKRENEAQGKASRLRHCLDNLEGAEKAVTRCVRPLCFSGMSEDDMLILPRFSRSLDTSGIAARSVCVIVKMQLQISRCR